MQLAHPIQITHRIRITDVKNPDDTITPTIVFRNHPSNSIRQRNRPVPFIHAGADNPEKRYYFCNQYLVPFVTFYPYLAATKHMSDTEVRAYTHSTLDMEDAARAYNIEHTYRVAPSTANRYLDMCIKQMASEGIVVEDICNLLSVSQRKVDKSLGNPIKESAREKAAEDAVEGANEAFRKSPEMRAIRRAVNDARRKGYDKGIEVSFSTNDAIPTMYDIDRSLGRDRTEKVLIKVCPVLRIPLDYNTVENNKSPNSIRVWRKTPGPDGMVGLVPGNVTIMSKWAADLIEGVQGRARLNKIGGETLSAFASWQELYGRRTKFDAVIGRPRAKKDADDKRSPDDNR